MCARPAVVLTVSSKKRNILLGAEYYPEKGLVAWKGYRIVIFMYIELIMNLSDWKFSSE